MSSRTTLVLADDSADVRERLRAVSKARRGLDVLAEADNAVALEGAVREHRPDVVIFDVGGAAASVVKTIRRLARNHPRVAVVVRADWPGERVAQVLDAGAQACVPRATTGSRLHDVIRTVASGRRIAPPVHGSGPSLGRQAIGILSPREREVLALTAQGENRREIAGRLGISPRTVEAHRANLMRKLGVRSQADLIRYALHHGVIPAWGSLA